jgi:GT2 family glycosyltransferase
MSEATAADVKPGNAPVRVDFASVVRDHLLVYGWILGLAEHTANAEIRYGNLVIDLMNLGFPVPRPDVTKHFSSQTGVDSDNHGFYLAAPLGAAGIRPGYLRLTVSQYSGESAESVWPVTSGDAPVRAFFQHDAATFDWLLQNLGTAEAKQLRELARSPEPTKSEHTAALGLDLGLGLDLCCALDARIIVLVGWFTEGDAPLTEATLTLGDRTVDCLPGLTAQSRPSALPSGEPPAHNLRGESVSSAGFTWVGAMPPAGVVPAAGATGGDALIELCAGARRGRVRRTLRSEGRSELKRYLETQDANAALDLLARIAALAAQSPGSGGLSAWLTAAQDAAVARLPNCLDDANPRVLLHCAGAVPIADAGVYLTGWFNADDGAVKSIACHSGFTRLTLHDRWIRQPRADVAEHLAKLGVPDADADHGFVCYAPLANTGAAYFLSVTLPDGTVRRMRLPPVNALASARHTVRTVLTSFNPAHRGLRTLLDSQVGPAVATAWARRRKPAPSVTSQRFGSVPANPAVSVIVPLFGRHDLADYQLALFADDADFQTLELIYFVDDPSIYDAFRARCDDLYEIYRVPFIVGFAGVNLGFAGANNCAASLATGKHLLLLNSDVLPKSPGWVREMRESYATLPRPGLLGAKLLYEDGSVQHAGMSFRRHAPWSGLWINAHPHKGQSAAGLSGLRKVDAVTAACALIDAGVYRELGGLSEDYIIGDFEDSDFCLRAAAAGRRSWVALDIELYHLERQSQSRIGDPQWRSNLTLFNCWQHQQRWGALLERRAT